MALPSGTSGRSVYFAADRHGRAAPWRGPRRARACRKQTGDRLLLRLSDDQRPVDHQRESRDRVPESEVAIAQASRFSQVCRVFAPVYRQITLSALDHPARITLADALIAYDSVLSAFRDYMAHYNHGRGIVFIGHSQGAAILIRLLKQEVDATPPVRRRLVSALLMGGNVTVRRAGLSGATSRTSPPAPRAVRPAASSRTRASLRSLPRTASSAGRPPMQAYASSPHTTGRPRSGSCA